MGARSGMVGVVFLQVRIETPIGYSLALNQKSARAIVGEAVKEGLGVFGLGQDQFQVLRVNNEPKEVLLCIRKSSDQVICGALTLLSSFNHTDIQLTVVRKSDDLLSFVDH
eukprot:c7888_g1_i1.p1 GENE.c7888_g1_i1~~c7888_g1_i1.p1  ORF type:complete len:111 (-),score=14.99 c7888_g1_i1:43-375(-)